MRSVDKFGLPIVTLIDTAGAYRRTGSERHIGEAIAVNLRDDAFSKTAIPWSSAWAQAARPGSGSAIACSFSKRIPFGHPVPGCSTHSLKNRIGGSRTPPRPFASLPRISAPTGPGGWQFSEPVGSAH